MKREEEIYAAALEIPAADRAAFLDRACGGEPALRERVTALLAANDEADAFFTNSALNRPPAIPEENPGDRIGRYKLLQKIGEGGCGVVYIAEQEEPVRRRVALKVIKLGMDTKEVIARFEAERQALALMDHPNIARVLDAGATDTGRPFFVMELVRGIPITRHCDEENLAPRQRLQLFMQVCHAIQHAHQKGIIHRDIKPTNILITMHDDVAVPKVIDFGIAKATQGRLTDRTVFTAFEQFMGTPAYMSPEQAQFNDLDVDARSDIYSLGVLLYELLTGRPPFDPKTLREHGIDEIRRIIREVEPPRPSVRLGTLSANDRLAIAKQRGTAPAQLSTLMRGDLDWIVMRALEKNRARRYDSANGLAADIQRHLGNEPVVARPPSVAYRFQKFTARRKIALAGGLAAVASLVVGLALSRVVFHDVPPSESSGARAQAGNTSIRIMFSGTHGAAAGVLSPDESAIAFVDWTGTGGALMVKNLRTGESRVVVGLEKKGQLYTPFPENLLWSPDSRSIAYTWYDGDGRSPSLRMIARDGGQPRTISNKSKEFLTACDWSRDGKTLLGSAAAADKSSSLVTLTVATGEIRIVGSVRRPGRHPRFSPDGRLVAYERNVDGNRDVFVATVDGDQTTRITDSPGEDGSPIFSADGRYVLFSSNRSGAWALWAIAVENGQPVADAFPVKYDFGDCDKMITATGKLVFGTTGNDTGKETSYDVFVLTAADRAAVAASKPVLATKTFFGRNVSPDWSHDGTKIAFVRMQGPRGGEPVLCVRGLDDGREETFEIGTISFNRVFWSPNGKALVLNGVANEVRGLYLFSLETRQLAPEPFSTGWPLGYSRDGKEFMVVSQDGCGRVAVSPETKAERAISPVEDAASLASAFERVKFSSAFKIGMVRGYDLSRDESKAALVEKHGNEQQLVVTDAKFQNRLLIARVTEPATISEPRWSPDGTKVAYFVLEKNNKKSLHVSAADGSWDAVGNTGKKYIDGSIVGPTWSADSTRLAVTLKEDLISQLSVLENFLPPEKLAAK